MPKKKKKEKKAGNSSADRKLRKVDSSGMISLVNWGIVDWAQLN